MSVPESPRFKLEHPPWATLALVAINVLVYLVTLPLSDETLHKLELVLGKGTHPLQWLTYNFVHVGLVQFLTNVLFLAIFGLIVEGKLGWWKFLLVSLGIGIFVGATIQMMTSPIPEPKAEAGGAVTVVEPSYGSGASVITYGLMGMCLIWAPQSNVRFRWLRRLRAPSDEVPIVYFALIYFTVSLLISVFTGQTGPWGFWGHAYAALVGAAVATVLLKLGLVNCEHWDAFAILAGHPGRSWEDYQTNTRPTPVAESESTAGAELEEKSPEERTANAHRRLRKRLDSGDALAAYDVYQTAVRTLPNWRPNEKDWTDLIKAVLGTQEWGIGVTVMEEYLVHTSTPAVRTRLKLAQILIREQQRPAYALRTLATIPNTPLPDSLEPVRTLLIQEAEKMIADGVLEIEGGAW